MTYGAPPENPALARVRQFAAAVRRGMAGDQPQLGAMPTQSPREHLNRLAGEAAAPILEQPTPPPGQTGPFGPQVAALADMRRATPTPAQLARRAPRLGMLSPRRQANLAGKAARRLEPVERKAMNLKPY